MLLLHLRNLNLDQFNLLSTEFTVVDALLLQEVLDNFFVKSFGVGYDVPLKRVFRFKFLFGVGTVIDQSFVNIDGVLMSSGPGKRIVASVLVVDVEGWSRYDVSHDNRVYVTLGPVHVVHQNVALLSILSVHSCQRVFGLLEDLCELFTAVAAASRRADHSEVERTVFFMFKIRFRLVFIHLTCKRSKSGHQDTSILLCEVSVLEFVTCRQHICGDFLRINKDSSVIDANIIAHRLENMSAITAS